MYKDKRRLRKSSVVRNLKNDVILGLIHATEIGYRKHKTVHYFRFPFFFLLGGGVELRSQEMLPVISPYSNLLRNQLVIFKPAYMRCLNIRQSSKRHTQLSMHTADNDIGMRRTEVRFFPSIFFIVLKPSLPNSNLSDMYL